MIMVVGLVTLAVGVGFLIKSIVIPVIIIGAGLTVIGFMDRYF